MLYNKFKLVVSLSRCLIFKMRQKKKKKKKNAGDFFSLFLYGLIAASARYTDKYLLTQMKLVKATIPGV